MEEFVVPDFVVGTSQGKIIQLDCKTMEQIEPEVSPALRLILGV
jgi:hypothetical protein